MNLDTLLILHIVPMEGLVEMAKTLLDDLKDLVQVGVTLGAIVVVGIVAIVTRLSIAKTFAVGFAAGIVAWLVTGGIQSIGDGVDSEFTEREDASAPIVQTYTPPTHPLR